MKAPVNGLLVQLVSARNQVQVFPFASDVHCNLARASSLGKTLASQRLFSACGLSILCIMDFIVII